MPGALVLFVVVPHMRCHDPLHETAQALLLFGHHQQMKMVRHQAVGVDFDGKLRFGGFEQVEKIEIILFIPKDPHPHIAAVDDMVDPPDRFPSGDSWHGSFLLFGFISKNSNGFRLKSSLSPFLNPKKH